VRLQKTNEQLNDPALLGDFTQLMLQVGAPLLSQLSSISHDEQPGKAESPECFLAAFRDEIICSVDLPTIHKSFIATTACGIREILSIDKALTENSALKPYAMASQRKGRIELKRLAPLRDHRTVQRYSRAVEEGTAQGWHTIVYGITMGLYALSPRQALTYYGMQTLRSMALVLPNFERNPSLLEDFLKLSFVPVAAAVNRQLSWNPA